MERIEAAAASALESEKNALNSANSATQSANTATQKASEAAESANIASTKAEQATEGANTSTQKASEALNSAENAKLSEDKSVENAKLSESYAVGGTGTRTGEDTDNAKYYNQQASDNADRAKEEADRASSIANIGIATTEKAGIVKPDGETIRVDPDGTIHADRGTTSYTDLENKPTINDIELNGNKTIDELGGLTEESTVSFTEAEERTNIEATDNVKGIFGKVRKWFADLKAVAFSGSYSDLSNRPSPLDTYEEITANTESGKFAGALGVQEGFTQLTTSLVKTYIHLENLGLGTYEELISQSSTLTVTDIVNAMPLNSKLVLQCSKPSIVNKQYKVSDLPYTNGILKITKLRTNDIFTAVDIAFRGVSALNNTTNSLYIGAVKGNNPADVNWVQVI